MISGGVMKHLFIINPVAGNGRTLEYVEKIKTLLGNKEDYIIEITQREGHATELAKQYTSKQDYRVYAVGGDGTVNEVLNGMAETKSSLAIIPAGSGNDFARTIYPSKYDEKELLSRLLTAESRLVDLSKVEDKYFLNIASVGLDAEVASNANQIKKCRFIKGEFAYILGIFKTLASFKINPLKVVIDKKIVLNKRILLMAVANGKYYGGGIKIAPKANVKDGQFDIYLVNDMGLIRILNVLPKLFKGTHEEVKEVEVYKAQQVKIWSKDPITVNIDGEIRKMGNIHMQIIPKAISIVMPFADTESKEEDILEELMQVSQ